MKKALILVLLCAGCDTSLVSSSGMKQCYPYQHIGYQTIWDSDNRYTAHPICATADGGIEVR
jgi:uncharacterized protein YceK